MGNGSSSQGSNAKLVEGVDYYFNEDGLMVLTAHYLLRRGYCCKNGCRHCPYGFRKPPADGGGG